MTAISQIDKQIDTIHRQLRGLEKIAKTSAASWQSAWDKHPELQQQERALYRQRGFVQQERDQKAYDALMRRPIRALRLKKCPTCKQPTLAA